MRIVVLVPSRGRPERAALMHESAMSTAVDPTTEVIVIVDPDDPTLPKYDGLPLVVLGERLGYTGSLNAVAARHWDTDCILGAFGDDVLFRTPSWDRIVAEALRSPGIAYGNDLVHAAGHPTAVWMSSDIARALGWLALPASHHLWVDDAWKALGLATGILRYLPQITVEHMHPAVGKAEMDETYHSVYEGVRAHQDHLGFLDWQQNGGLEADAAKVRAVLDA